MMPVHVSLSRCCIAAFGIGLWSSAGCTPSPDASAARAPAGVVGADGAPREVVVAEARPAVWERVLRLTGELVSAEESTISTKVAGRLESLDVDVGTRVQRGQVLARIELRDFELHKQQAEAALEAARAMLGLAPGQDGASVDPEKTAIVRAARAELAQAARELERQKSLVTGGAATQSALDVATTAAQSAESQLQGAQETIATRRATLAQREVELALAAAQVIDASIVAPYDGIVAERLAGTGDFLTVGAPVAHVLRVDPVRLRVVVPEQSSGQIHIGQELRAHFDSGMPDLVTHVTRFAPALGERDRTLFVEADIANPEGALRPGSFVRAELVLDPEARTLVIPAAALVRFAGIDKVFVEEADVAVERRVRVGRSEKDRIEVEDGLKAGEFVVLEPGKLQGGTHLKVRAKD